MAEFNIGDFYRAVLDIEKYLGYLKGNELAYDYLQSVNDASRFTDTYDSETYDQEYVGLRDWHTPCDDGQFQVHFQGGGGGLSEAYFLVPFNASESERQAIRDEIKANLTKAWNNGPTWSEGIYEYVNDVTRQFVKPDVQTMAQATHTIANDVVEELRYEINDDWANIEYLLDDWHGDGAGAFTNFYSNFNDVLARFGMMAGHVAVGFAAGTRIINGYQQAVMEFVDSVREGLRGLLAMWVEGQRPPSYFGSMEFPAWIADAYKIAKPIYDVLKLIPQVKAVTAPVDAIITITTSASTLIGMLPEGQETVKAYDFAGSEADAVYEEFTNKLFSEFYQAYTDAMQEVADPGGEVNVDAAADVGFSASRVEQELLELQGDLAQWDLPEVPPGSLYDPGRDSYPG